LNPSLRSWAYYLSVAGTPLFILDAEIRLPKILIYFNFWHFFNEKTGSWPKVCVLVTPISPLSSPFIVCLQSIHAHLHWAFYFLPGLSKFVRWFSHIFAPLAKWSSNHVNQGTLSAGDVKKRVLISGQEIYCWGFPLRIKCINQLKGCGFLITTLFENSHPHVKITILPFAESSWYLTNLLFLLQTKCIKASAFPISNHLDCFFSIFSNRNDLE